MLRKRLLKMLYTDGNGVFSREDCILYGEKVCKAIFDHGLSPVEAYFSYCGMPIMMFLG